MVALTCQIGLKSRATCFPMAALPRASSAAARRLVRDTRATWARIMVATLPACGGCRPLRREAADRSEMVDQPVAPRQTHSAGFAARRGGIPFAGFGLHVTG